MFRFFVLACIAVSVASVCQDQHADCANVGSSCYSTNPQYLQWIRSICPVTCGVCNPNNNWNNNNNNNNNNWNNNNNNGNCQDQPGFNCQWEILNNNMCNSIYYTQAQKKMYCGKSCHLC